jgi:hypothetical protein
MDVRALSAEDRLELERKIGDGLEMLGLAADSDDPAQVLAAIGRCIDAVRAGASPPVEAAIALGALWGDELRRSQNWRWVRLGDELALISPDQAATVRPAQFVMQLLVG